MRTVNGAPGSVFVVFRSTTTTTAAAGLGAGPGPGPGPERGGVAPKSHANVHVGQGSFTAHVQRKGDAKNMYYMSSLRRKALGIVSLLSYSGSIVSHGRAPT